MADLIKLRRATEAQWESVNPVLSEGEPGWDTTNNEIRFGDGTTAWIDLEPIGGSGGGGGPTTAAGVSTVPAGNLAATNVQTSLAELDAEKAALTGAAFVGTVSAASLTPTGLTGATAATRFVGATNSGAPVTGTFLIGDFVITRDGGAYVCTVAGSPGTWAAIGGPGSGAALLALLLPVDGTGSGLDADKLDGIEAVGFQLANSTGKTANYTLTSTDATIRADATAGAITMTLPSASGITAGRRVLIKKIDSTANAVTIATSSSQTIDGVLTRTLALGGEFLMVESDGSNWRISGGSPGPKLSIVDLSQPPYNITPSDANIATTVATALTNTAGNAILYIPAGTYNWITTVSTFRYLHLRGAGEGRTIINYTAAANPVIQVAGGTNGAVRSITADVAAGDQTITVSDATSIVTGSILSIKSAKSWEPSIVSGKGGKYGELVRVLSVSGLVVTLTQPTKWAYAVADTPLCDLQAMSHGPTVQDMTWRNTTPNTGTGTVIRMRRCVDARIERCSFEFIDGPAIEGNFLVWGCTVYDCQFLEGSVQFGSGRYSYGVNMANGSRDWTVIACRQRGGRHLFTTNADSVGHGIPYSARIEACSATGSYEAPFDTHHEGCDITFNNCTAEGTRAFCFQGRAPRTRFLNCSVLGGSGVGFIMRDTAAGSVIANAHIQGLVNSSAASGSRAVWLQNLDGPMTVSGVVAQDIYGAMVYVEAGAGGHVIENLHGVRVATGEDSGAIVFTGTSANHVIRNVHLTDIGSGVAVYGPATVTNVTGIGRTGDTDVAGGMTVTDVGGGGGGGVDLTTNQTVAGEKTFTSPLASRATSTDITPFGRALDVALQNTSATNLNYMTIGHYDSGGTIDVGAAFQTINHSTHLGRFQISTRTAAGFGSRLAVDDGVTVTNLRETATTGNATGAVTIDLTTGTVHSRTLTGNTTFTFSGSSAGVASSFTLILTQDGTGGRTVTWPASVDWPGGTAPTISSVAGRRDVFTFVTVDNGTTWLGTVAGQAFS